MAVEKESCHFIDSTHIVCSNYTCDSHVTDFKKVVIAFTLPVVTKPVVFRIRPCM